MIGSDGDVNRVALQRTRHNSLLDEQLCQRQYLFVDRQELYTSGKRERSFPIRVCRDRKFSDDLRRNEEFVFGSLSFQPTEASSLPRLAIHVLPRRRARAEETRFEIDPCHDCIVTAVKQM